MATATLTGVGHIGLNVSRITEAQAFFTDTLGFDLLGAGDKDGSPYAFLGLGGALVLTLWGQSATGTAFRADTPGLHHLAFAVENIAHLEEIRQRLTGRGVTFFHAGAVVAHREGGASSAIYFAGPDGIRLEITAPDGGAGLPAPAGAAPTCGFF